MLHRALDDTYDPDVRAHITLTTASRTVANGAFRFAAPFLAVIAKGNGVSLAGVGAALAVGELAGLASPLLGVMVEQLQRRTAMSVGLAGVAAASVLAAASTHVVVLAIALVVLGQSKSVFDLGLMAWVSDRVPYAQRSRVIGINETSWAFGLLLGVSGMGLITEFTNYRIGYATAAVAVAIASLACRRIAPDPAEHHANTRTRAAIHRRRATATLVGMYSLMAASQCVFITFGGWLVDRYGFSAAQLSAVTFGLGFCELFASTSSARKADGWGKERSTAIGAAVMVPCGVVVALGHDHLWVGLPFVVIAIAAFEFGVVSAIPLGTELVPGSPARGVGIMFAAGTFGRASMSFVATRVYSHSGMTWPPLMTAGFATVVVLAMWRLRAISR